VESTLRFQNFSKLNAWWWSDWCAGRNT